MSLLPPLFNSISLRLIIIKNDLALSRLVPYSLNDWIFLGVIWSGCCLKSNISIGYFDFKFVYYIKVFNICSPINSFKNISKFFLLFNVIFFFVYKKYTITEYRWPSSMIFSKINIIKYSNNNFFYLERLFNLSFGEQKLIM